jgi:CSLREA domain-containing protein
MFFRALLVFFLVDPAHAAVFTVNSPSDGLDANPGNGVCETMLGNGICTLRAAIQETNALAGDDTIILPPNTYGLTIDFSPSDNPLIIAGNLTITGGGASTTIIQGSLEPGRVLVINAGIAVNISGLTIRRAGLASPGIGNSGTLTLTDSAVSDNSGSGIFNSGTATLINSTVSGSSPGGGIFNSGTATLINGTVSRNHANGNGGGVFNSGTMTLINSTVSGNSADGFGGGGISNSGILALTSSTVSENLARSPGPNTRGFGGGISNSGVLTLTNSTVSTNGAFLDGGGIYNSGIANVFSSTITNNQADVEFKGRGVGGGIFNSNNGTFNFQNTILGGNFETFFNIFLEQTVFVFGDCGGTINSLGNSLLQAIDSSHCMVAGEFALTDPKLGALQNNGGPTQTHALLSGSPAIDTGNPGGCRDEFGALLTTDQRGINRSAAGCDIGAFELQQATGVVAAVLPSSRSVQVNTPAAVFATVINTGQAIAASCSISPLTGVPASFIYQTTDPATNQVTGFPNTPADIAAGATQSFVFAITPTAPIAPTDVQFSFDCSDTDPAPISVGLNTLLLSASDTPVPDIVALAVTLSNDGIVNVSGTNGAGAFAVATVNLGATETITASADTGSASLPVIISLCQTNPPTGQCISTIGPSVTTTINANTTPTFGIFVQGNGTSSL